MTTQNNTNIHTNGNNAIAIDATNTDVLNAIFHTLPQQAHIAVCSKSGDPTEGGWNASQYQTNVIFDAGQNNYFNCSSFFISDTQVLSAKKEYFAGLHAIVLDDVGSKIPTDKLGELKASAKIETSPGNYQVILILDKPILNIDEATAFQKRFIKAGLCDSGASGACRWARLPVGINGKARYQQAGESFHCSLVEWNPELRHSLEELEVWLTLTNEPSANTNTKLQKTPVQSNALYQPKPKVNPVIGALSIKGLYKQSMGKGQHQITCPWVQEHTDAVDNGSMYFEPSRQFPMGGFKCHHSHGDQYSISDLLNHLDVSAIDARFQSVIRIQNGELHTIVEAVSLELANINNLYQMGNLLVKIIDNSKTGHINTLTLNLSELTLMLSECIAWMKFDGNQKQWVRTDPYPKAVSSIFESRHLDHVKTLKGIALQPFYRETTGELVLASGYDSESQIYGAFDLTHYQLPEPTLENAKKALNELEALMQEFMFATELDKATALSMLFTAVTRPSLDLAPAFHVRASMSGSGKSYLCALAGAFATPGNRQTVPYAKSADEAKKILLSLLMDSPAVIEFDDLDDDIKPHSIMKQVLTSEYITDRILGQSKTATVSTRTLFMFSGNNVGPVRDLLRRVITINLSRQEENPTQVVYQSNPVMTVKRNRERYIGHILTIIEAWKKAGKPINTSVNVVTYDGSWSDYCRHPLIWLGLQDPARALVDQVSHDPDAEMVGNLLKAWFSVYKTEVVTIRKILKNFTNSIDLNDPLFEALEDCPVNDHKGINPSKLGWYLKKNMNRPVAGFKLIQGSADGRTAWQVIATNPTTEASEATTKPQPIQTDMTDNGEAF